MTHIAKNGLPDRRYRTVMNTYFISCEDCGTDFTVRSEDLDACEEVLRIYKDVMHSGCIVHVEKNIGNITLSELEE